MVYWVFTEAQLEEALAAWLASREFQESGAGTSNDTATNVRLFLRSAAAHDHKLRAEDKSRG